MQGKLRYFLAGILFLACFLVGEIRTVSAAALNTYPLGTAIQITGQGGAVYKFIKMNDANYNNDGTGDTYWMFADSYCNLPNRPSNCVIDSSGTTSTSSQIWDSANLVNNNWTLMSSSPGSIYQQTIQPFYNDLPNNIGGLPKNMAISNKAYDMRTVVYTTGTGTTSYGTGSDACYLTAHPQANLADCTWTDRVSLASYKDWQIKPDGTLGANGYFGPSGPANAYSLTRFGKNWSSPSGMGWAPWFRTPLAQNTVGNWYATGSSATSSVYFTHNTDKRGVSPVLWLSASIQDNGQGSGTYADPYRITTSNGALLNTLPLGTAIQLPGKNGANYKFIKMNDANYNNDGTGDTYWMLADNYCGLNGRPSDCLNTSGLVSTTSQVWNPVSDGSRFNNWTTMSQTSGSVYQQILQPFYNDLPNSIGNLSKTQALPNKGYDMRPVVNTSANPTSYGSGTNACYLTVSSQADLTSCTWTDRVSLPSYADWQGMEPNGTAIGGIGYYTSSGPAYSYSMTRFGKPWAYYSPYLFDGWSPWLRSPLASNTNNGWGIVGNATNHAVYFYPNNTALGVSPVLWLSSTVMTNGQGAGTYVSPYQIDTTNDIPPTLGIPVATWDNSQNILSIAGNIQLNDPGQEILIRATACNTQGQCLEKTNSLTADGSVQPFSLNWNGLNLPSGAYNGTIWVEAVTNPTDSSGWSNRFAAAQTNAVNFSIAPRVMDLTAVRNRPFNFILGDASAFNLSPGTDQGVTVAIDPTTNQLSVSGTLANDTQITFGSAILNFHTLDIPQSALIDSSFSN